MSDIVFQLHFATVTDLAHPFQWYQAKYQEEKETAQGENFFRGGGRASSSSVFWGQSRCTVLLKGRMEGTGEHCLVRVKGFMPWFYLIDYNSPAAWLPDVNAAEAGEGERKFALSEIDHDTASAYAEYYTDELHYGDHILRFLNANDSENTARRFFRSNASWGYEVHRERRKLFDGFEPNPHDGGATARRYTCYKICCPSKKAKKVAIDILSRNLDNLNAFTASSRRLLGAPAVTAKYKFGLAGHETNISPLIQYYAQTSLHPMAWISVPAASVLRWYKVSNAKGGGLIVHESKSLSYRADWELKCNVASVVYIDGKVDVAPLNVIVMDLETYSYTREFPTPDDPRNPIMNIGVREYRYNRKNTPDGPIIPAEATSRGIQFVLKDCDREGYYAKMAATNATYERRDFTLRQFEDEKDMLLAYRDYLVNEFDVDIIMTWNGTGFDDNYLATRAKLLFRSDSSDFFKMSTLKGHVLKLEKEDKTSNQKGDSEMYVWKSGSSFVGRILDLDMMNVVKADVTRSFRSYALDFVAFHLFGDRKIDLPAAKMFSNFDAGPAERFETAEYCDKDCELPFRTEQKLQGIMSLCQMAAATRTEIYDILYKGQTKKAYNLIIYTCHQKGVVLNRKANLKMPDKYQGAIVIETAAGWYTVPIPVLDFMSLYPSIMISQNLCMSTELHDPAGLVIGNAKTEEQSTNLARLAAQFPNLRMNMPAIPDEDAPGGYVCPVFVENEVGILPQILESLLAKRKVAKRNMAAAYKSDDEVMGAVYNAIQNALKVSANSVYGFTGAPLAPFPRITVAASVTYFGRLGIEKTRGFLEEKYTAQYCYCVILKMDRVPDAVISMYEKIFQTVDPAKILSQCIGGDTDSVFMWFPVLPTEEGLACAVRIAKYASQECTDLLFKKPMELEYEKTYWPAIFCKKKRYAAGKYVSGTERPADVPFESESKWRGYIEMKGLETVRRDVPMFTSKLMVYILHSLLIQRDVQRAYAFIGSELQRLLDGRFDYEEMMITSQLKAEASYNDPDTLAHVQVVRHMRERNPGSEYRVGDRVKFVYVARDNASQRAQLRKKKAAVDAGTAAKKKKTKEIKLLNADFAEDMHHAEAAKMPLNLEYYFCNKIRKPISKIMETSSPEIVQVLAAWEARFVEHSRFAACGNARINRSALDCMIRTRPRPAAASSKEEGNESLKRKAGDEQQQQQSTAMYIPKRTKLAPKDAKKLAAAQSKNVLCLLKK